MGGKFAEDPTGSRVIPIRVHNVPLNGLLSTIVYVDLVDKGEVAATHELLTRIKQERAKPPCPPAFPGTIKPTFPGDRHTGINHPVTFKAVITGTITESDKALIEAIVQHLRKISDDASLTLLAVQKGSLVLVLRCSFRGFERLKHLYEGGSLNVISGFVLKDLTVSEELGQEGRVKQGSAEVEQVQPEVQPIVTALTQDLKNDDYTIASDAAYKLQRMGSVVTLPLVAALRDDNELLRRRAAEVLGRIGDEAQNAVPALAAALRNDNYRVSSSAAYALQRIGAFAVPTLVVALRDDSERVRQMAAEALAGIDVRLSGSTSVAWQASGAISTLVSALRDDNALVQRIAEQVLLEATTAILADAVPSLVATLQDQRAKVRQIVMMLLQRITADGRGSRIVSALVAALQDDDVQVRRDAAQVLGCIANEEEFVFFTDQMLREPMGHIAAESLSVLIAALQDDIWQVRRRAAEVLRRVGPDAYYAIPALVEVLGDQDSSVREAAVEALRRIGGVAVPTLILALQNGNEEGRQNAAKILEQIGPAANAAVPVLIHNLQDKSWEVRQAATGALQRIGTEATPALILALQSDSEGARETAAHVLGLIGLNALNAVPTLVEALQDECHGIREAAAEALQKIGAEAITLAFQDDSERMRQNAADILEQIGPAPLGAVPALIQRVQDTRWEVRHAAVAALIGIRQVAVLALIGLLHRESGELQQTTEALHRVWHALIEVLQDEIEQMRQAAVEALGRIGQVAVLALIGPLQRESEERGYLIAHELKGIWYAAMPALVTSLQDQSRQVRQIAAGALAGC